MNNNKSKHIQQKSVLKKTYVKSAIDTNTWNTESQIDEHHNKVTNETNFIEKQRKTVVSIDSITVEYGKTIKKTVIFTYIYYK